MDRPLSRPGPSDQSLIATEMTSSDGAVAGLAVVAIILGRNVGADEFAIGGTQRIRLMQKDFRQLAERRGGLGTERHGSAYAGKPIGKFNVRHGFYSPQGDGKSEFCSWKPR